MGAFGAEIPSNPFRSIVEVLRRRGAKFLSLIGPIKSFRPYVTISAVLQWHRTGELRKLDRRCELSPTMQ